MKWIPFLIYICNIVCTAFRFLGFCNCDEAFTVPYIHTYTELNCCYMYDRCTMQEPSFLNNLEKGRHSHGIVVRVIRKWIHYENNGQGPPLYVGMVLADAKVLTRFFSIHYSRCFYVLCKNTPISPSETWSNWVHACTNREVLYMLKSQMTWLKTRPIFSVSAKLMLSENL